MPSSATPLLRLEDQETGENLNTWGDKNDNNLALIEEAIAGVQAKSLTGNVTLTATNYVSNEYRHSVLVFTDGGLSSAPTVTVPAVEKNWLVHNKGSAYAVNISCGGTTASVLPGQIVFVYSDGTDCFVSNEASLAKDWATKVSAAVETGAFSAKEYAQGTQASTGGSAKNWAQQTGAAVTGASANDRSAKAWAQSALTGATLGGSAKDWAQTTGGTVDGTDYAAKEYAIGTTVPAGSAKKWATTTGAQVDGSEYSAKEYASGSTVPTGSAKEWATQLTTEVETGQGFSARQYALNAADSATTAANEANDAAASAAAALASEGAAASSASAADASADAAAASAAGVNLPAITVADANELIKVNAGGTGYVTTTTTIDANGKLIPPASATGSAGFRLIHGSAPTSPVDGDVWTTTAGLFAQINGGTQGPYPTSAAAYVETVTTIGTAVANVSYTLPANASNVFITWKDLGQDQGTSQNLQFQYSTDNGTSWSSAQNTGASIAAASTVDGGIALWMTGGTSALMIIFAHNFNISGDAIAATFTNRVFDTSARLTNIRFLSATGNLDEGTFRRNVI